MHKIFSALTLAIFASPSFAYDQFSMATGFDYSSGTYGNAASTHILYVPVTATYESDNLTLKLTVPYLSISGPGGVVQGMGRMGPAINPTTGRNSATTTITSTNSGLGDITASAGYNMFAGDAFALDLIGRIKFGTADSTKGLGTGQNDLSAQVDGYYTVARTSLFATVGYKHFGAPAGITLQNAPYGTIGISQKLGESVSAGAMFDVAKSASAGTPDRREVTLYASRKLSPTLKVQANVLKGFSTSSADFGGGISITSAL